jgi:hypothetical protein
LACLLLGLSTSTDLHIHSTSAWSSWGQYTDGHHSALFHCGRHVSHCAVSHLPSSLLWLYLPFDFKETSSPLMSPSPSRLSALTYLIWASWEITWMTSSFTSFHSWHNLNPGSLQQPEFSIPVSGLPKVTREKKSIYSIHGCHYKFIASNLSETSSG